MGLLPSYAPRQVNLPALYFNTPAPAMMQAYHPSMTERVSTAVSNLASKVLPKRVAQKVGDLTGYSPVGALTGGYDAGQDLARGNYLSGAIGAAANLLPDVGPAAKGMFAHAIIAPLYHGSPHKFEKFMLEKIGTGEGAQAYGHGLYFAENPATATDYRQRLAGYSYATFGGEPIPPNPTHFTPELRDWLKGKAKSLKIDTSAGAGLTADQVARNVDAIAPYSLGSALAAARDYARAGDDVSAELLSRADKLEARASKPTAYGPDKVSDLVSARVHRALAADPQIAITQPGHLYEVSLNANPEDFLNWDAPLSQQPKPVSDALGSLEAQRQEVFSRIPQIDGSMPYEEFSRRYGSDLDKAAGLYADPKLTGAQFYHRTPNKVEATQRLQSLGIPGIRYLDQGSRTAGQGTHNYVVFDPSIISILNRQ